MTSPLATAQTSVSVDGDGGGAGGGAFECSKQLPIELKV